MKSIYVFLFALILANPALNAQKKPLDHSVYDAWQNIGERKISNNGKWIAYNIDPQEGDSRLVVTNSSRSGNKYFNRGVKPVFTSDSEFFGV